MGQSAWADDVVFTQVASYDFEGETPTNPFTDNSGISGRCSAAIYADEGTSSAALKFSGSNLYGKTYGYQVYDFSTSTASSSSVKIEFDFKIENQNHTHFTIRDASVASETNKGSYSGTGAIFRFGNSRVNSVNSFGYNGNAVTGASYGTWYHIDVIVDVVNKKVSYTLKSIDQTTTIDSQTNLDFLNASAVACTQLDFFGISNADMASIDNIVISEYTSSSATTYSVIKYDKNGNVITSTSDLAGVAGETSSASDADRATFYSADTNSKYVFDATDERNVTSMELTSTVSSNVLKLYFDTYTKQNCTVTATDGTNDLGTIASGSFYSDETSTTLYWSKFINVDDTWYETEADAIDYFSHTFTSAGEHSVTYTSAPDVIYFAEWNNICVRTYNNWSGAKASGGNATILANSTNGSNAAATTATISGGQVVDIYVSGYSCRGNATYTKVFYLTDGTTDTEIGRLTFTDQAFNTQVIKNVYIASDAKIKTIIASGNDHLAGDYIYVKKVSNVPATITSAGWATLYTTYALDFSTVEGLEAYTATVSDNTVTLTKVSTIPAGTGVVLKATETINYSKTYTIPVTTSSETPKGDMKGSTEATAYNAVDGSTLYILTKLDNGNVQFNPCTSGEIAAGKAYLPISTGTPAKALSVVFFNDPTGIANVNAAEATQPVKRIVNGQLVIEKNGKRYNAAGAEF